MSQIVINAKERQQAFWKFLLLFLLAVGLVVTAFYFDTLVPTKDNKMMRSQVENFRTQEAAQDKFVRAMNETKVLIDSLRKPGAQRAYLNSLINEKLKTMSAMQFNDSSMYSALNASAIDVFNRYTEATNKVIELGDMPINVQTLKDENAKLNSDLLQTRALLSQCLNAPPR